MTTSSDLKRQNFNVTPEQEADLLRLQRELGSPSVKDAILRATNIVLFFSVEIKNGRRISLKDRSSGIITEVALPDLETASFSGWTYLTERPHSWKRQLFVKGRRLTAAQVWLDMTANGMTAEEAAENWDLPLAAVHEIVDYCVQNHPLIKMEADEERQLLLGQGIGLPA